MEPKFYRRKTPGRSDAAILALVQPGSTVLEMGCATGSMTRILSEDMNCDVVGVERVPEQAEEAKPYASTIIVGDITRDETWRQISETCKSFDYVIFADVLEHLPDPWHTLRLCSPLLCDTGRVIASIPNIAYYSIRLKLLKGEFNYKKYGVMDDTHLRFFTPKTARRLFDGNGYTVDEFIRVYRKPRWLMARLFPDAYTYHIVISARPHSSADHAK